MGGMLEYRLAALALCGQTISYGALARELGLRIGALTAQLEQLMAQDAQAGRPYLAITCEAKLNNTLPAEGFFQCAEALGRPVGRDAAAVAAHRDALRLALGQNPLPLGNTP